MTRHAFVGGILAALVLTAGLVGAAPAAASSPRSTPNGTAGATPSGGLAAVGGPPSTLPGPVPDFVGSILNLVGQFLDGTLDALGPAVSDAASSEGPSRAA